MFAEEERGYVRMAEMEVWLGSAEQWQCLRIFRTLDV